MVVMHHISASSIEYFDIPIFSNVFVIGWNGVDFFFVLSGFIITYIHYQDIKNSNNFQQFIFKRAVRIYPIYWIIAIVSLVFYLKSGALNIGKDYMYIIKSFLLIKQHQAPFLGVAWSLIYEVFFYGLFAIFILLGLKVARVAIPVWLLLILAGGFFQLNSQTSIVFSNFNILFIFGCFTAYTFLKFSNNLKRYAVWIFVIGVMTFIISCFISLYTEFGSKSALESRFMYGLSSSMIILGSTLLDLKKTRYVPKFWLLLGDASYVLYLSHLLVLAIIFKVSIKLKDVSGLYNLSHEIFIYALSLISIVLSVLFSILLHKTVELNLMKFFNYNLFISRFKIKSKF